MDIKYIFGTLLIIAMSVCCDNLPKGDSDKVKEEIAAFANAYFNYDLKTAARHCTPESKIWFRYLASNIHQADVEVLKKAPEGASIEIKDINYDDNDTTGTAIVAVNNYLRLDTIGKAGRMIDNATFRIPIIYREGRWTVKMANLLRSEKPSHDSTKDE
jgi:hypothetical protein